MPQNDAVGLHSQFRSEKISHDARIVARVAGVHPDHIEPGFDEHFEEQALAATDFEKLSAGEMGSDAPSHVEEVVPEGLAVALFIVISLIIDHEVRFEGSIVNKASSTILRQLDIAWRTGERFRT